MLIAAQILVLQKHSCFSGTGTSFCAVSPAWRGARPRCALPRAGPVPALSGGRGRPPLAARERGAGADWLARGVPAAGAPTAPLSGGAAAGAERSARDAMSCGE